MHSRHARRGPAVSSDRRVRGQRVLPATLGRHSHRHSQWSHTSMPSEPAQADTRKRLRLRRACLLASALLIALVTVRPVERLLWRWQGVRRLDRSLSDCQLVHVDVECAGGAQQERLQCALRRGDVQFERVCRALSRRRWRPVAAHSRNTAPGSARVQFRLSFSTGDRVLSAWKYSSVNGWMASEKTFPKDRRVFYGPELPDEITEAARAAAKAVPP